METVAGEHAFERVASDGAHGSETNSAAGAALLGVDWGTTSLRAYVFDSAGRVQLVKQAAWGLMHVESLTGKQGAAAYASIFKRVIDLLPGLPGDVPVIACGMVGSAQGWADVPYVPVPALTPTLASRLHRVVAEGTGKDQPGREVWIVPGCRQDDATPNVMRGEETQIVGAMALRARGQTSGGSYGHSQGVHAGRLMLYCLPGSHSKWAQCTDDEIVRFDTFMTGEAFHALSTHTILAKTMTAAPVSDDAAFERGVCVALEPESKGLLSNLFSCRALSLFGKLSGAQQRDYLSGVLIGAELNGMRATLQRDRTQGIGLIGDRRLCSRYGFALQLMEVPNQVTLIERAAEHGLWRLARSANLVSAG